MTGNIFEVTFSNLNKNDKNENLILHAKYL